MPRRHQENPSRRCDLLLVQCDFDDTISNGNVSAAVRAAFAPDGWRQMEEEYLAGKYSVEESNIRQFALVRATEQQTRDFVKANVVVRDGFAEFVRHCLGHHMLPVVVSSGLDLYVTPTMQRLGLGTVEAHSATTEVTETGITVEYLGPSGTTLTRRFKDSFLSEFKRLGHTVVYVGDGLSDRAPAMQADFAIARSELASYLDEQGHPHYTFETFDDVRRHVDDIRHSVGA